ncbi:MAG: hypothetical protein MUP41_13870 [Desulfobacterales bacterium]|nr:hypothetical protein [Desulfobacterales bacterium]
MSHNRFPCGRAAEDRGAIRGPMGVVAAEPGPASADLEDEGPVARELEDLVIGARLPRDPDEVVVIHVDPMLTC